MNLMKVNSWNSLSLYLKHMPVSPEIIYHLTENIKISIQKFLFQFWWNMLLKQLET